MNRLQSDRPRLVLPLGNELLKALLAWNLSQTADCAGWLLTPSGERCFSRSATVLWKPWRGVNALGSRSNWDLTPKRSPWQYSPQRWMHGVTCIHLLRTSVPCCNAAFLNISHQAGEPKLVVAVRNSFVRVGSAFCGRGEEHPFDGGGRQPILFWW